MILCPIIPLDAAIQLRPGAPPTQFHTASAHLTAYTKCAEMLRFKPLQGAHGVPAGFRTARVACGYACGYRRGFAPRSRKRTPSSRRAAVPQARLPAAAARCRVESVPFGRAGLFASPCSAAIEDRERERSICWQPVDRQAVSYVVDYSVVESAAIACSVDSECAALARIDVVLPYKLT
jgi:hypothetical protein